MTCADLTELFEPWAVGELSPSPEAVAHLNSCERCASRLALARQVDRLLAAREGQQPSRQFSQDVLRRLRRDWWRAEQALDRWFNAGVGVGFIFVVGGIWLLFNLSGLTAVTNDAASLVASGVAAAAQEMRQSLAVYAWTTLLLVAAWMIWRWTDRDLI